MLLELVLILVCVALAQRFWLRGPKKIRNEDSKAPAKLGFIQSISVQLAFLFENHAPNYELGLKWHRMFGNFCYIMHPFKNIAMGSISDLTLAKKIMSSADWSDRFEHDHYIYSFSFGKPLGLIFGNGGYWKEARKLTMKLLHQLDFYRQENLEKFINFELRDLQEGMLKAVSDGGGKATMTMHHKFQIYALNIVYQVMLNKRFERDDPMANKILALTNDANREFNVGTSILEIFPWLLRVPFLKIMKKMTGVADFLNDYFKKELLDPKRRAKRYEQDPVDFVDHFLLEIDRRAQESPRYLTDENLITSLRDLIFGGADTTNTALEHGILHVALNPLIQRKIQEEIDQVIGTGQPEYNHRFTMPYTQAALHEILRISTPLPVSTRCPLNDNEINGEPIPKGSLFAINLYAIHHSPDLWKDPEEFQPERFLNDNNELINLDKLMPFGWGKRMCVGENVARISFFLFFVMLMQTFSFEISQDHPPPSMNNQMGLSTAPFPYYVTVKCRESKRVSMDDA